MKTSALAPAVMIAAAAATFGIGSSAAHAAAPCPTPEVTISPSQNVAPNAQVKITGHGFLCDVKGGFVYVNATYSGEPLAAMGNGPRAHVASDGSFSYDAKTSGPAGAKWTITVDGAFSSVRAQASIILADPASDGTDPTAVPAGHVNPSARTNTGAEWGVAALGGAGAALIGAGVTTARRRRLTRSHG